MAASPLNSQTLNPSTPQPQTQTPNCKQTTPLNTPEFYPLPLGSSPTRGCLPLTHSCPSRSPHLHPPATACYCLPLTLPSRLHPPATACYCLPLTPLTCIRLLLPATACYCLPLTLPSLASTCYCLLLPASHTPLSLASTCYCLLLPAPQTPLTCIYLLLPAPHTPLTCIHLLLPATACPSHSPLTCIHLLLPATACPSHSPLTCIHLLLPATACPSHSPHLHPPATACCSGRCSGVWCCWRMQRQSVGRGESGVVCVWGGAGGCAEGG